MSHGCLMTLKTQDAIMRNQAIMPEVLRDAALACRCKDCNEALTRYAEIQLRRQFATKEK